MASNVCPSCFNPLIPCQPFAYPNHERQLELPVESYSQGVREETIVKGEGRYAKPQTRYWMKMWECTTEGCSMRGAIHDSRTASSREVSDHTEPRRFDEADTP